MAVGLAMVTVLVARPAPAEAVTLAYARFTGVITVAGGLGFPCTPPGVGCAAETTTTTTPKPDFGTPNPQVTVTNGNTHNFTFLSTLCLGYKVDVAKPDKGTNAYTPHCGVAANGTVTGFCGLASGTGGGAVSYLGAPSGQKTLAFNFRFHVIGGLLFVDGGATTKGAGYLKGEMYAVADPAAAGTCTNKTQTRFLVLDGYFAFVDAVQ